MCISPDAYVEARVYDRLVSKGVDPPRAAAVARKVRRAYAAQRKSQNTKHLVQKEGPR